MTHDVTRRRTHAAGVVLVTVLSALLVLVGSALIVSRASAAWTQVTETGEPGYLSLRSDPGAPQWSDLRPGDVEHWLIEASLGDADVSTLRLELHADGPLVSAGDMTVSVSGCSVPFTDLQCAGTAQSVLSEASLADVAGADAGIHPLLDLHRGAPRYLLVTLALAQTASAEEVAGASARIGVGLHASGADPDDPDDPLAVTGADAGDLIPVGILAAGMLGLGVAALFWRRDRRSGRAQG